MVSRAKVPRIATPLFRGGVRASTRCVSSSHIASSMPPIPTVAVPREPTPTVGGWVDLAQRLLVCGRRLREQLHEQLEERLLSEAEFSVLWVCASARSPGPGQNELARALAVSPAQISGLVEQLRRKRLLAGRRAANDRRRQLWRLTPNGKSVVQAVLIGLEDWARGLDLALGEEHRTLLGRFVDPLFQQVRPADAGPDCDHPRSRRRGAA